MVKFYPVFYFKLGDIFISIIMNILIFNIFKICLIVYNIDNLLGTSFFFKNDLINLTI